VGESIERPLAYYRINVALDTMVRFGTRNRVLELVRNLWDPATLPVAEDAPQNPISPYGRSKLTCEQILADAAAASGLSTACLRYFNAS
jgi:UDP-glucose 4-epimerase